MVPPIDVFWLGAHEPSWLKRVDIPLFVSHRRFVKANYRTFPRARGPWALDSGAFSEVSMFGEFRTSPQEYVTAVRRYRDEVGNLVWAAPQDHMCEPFVLAKSRLASTVEQAQDWTVESLLTLRSLAPELPIIPVLQGQRVRDYHRHVERYARVGVDLCAEPVVGLGSVCRRQATGEIGALVGELSFDGIRLHGFGVKADGLRLYGWGLTSADSMAWSYAGRSVRCPLKPSRRCGECLHFALAWRARALSGMRP